MCLTLHLQQSFHIYWVKMKGWSGKPKICKPCLEELKRKVMFEPQPTHQPASTLTKPLNIWHSWTFLNTGHCPRHHHNNPEPCTRPPVRWPRPSLLCHWVASYSLNPSRHCFIKNQSRSPQSQTDTKPWPYISNRWSRQAIHRWPPESLRTDSKAIPVTDTTVTDSLWLPFLPRIVSPTRSPRHLGLLILVPWRASHTDWAFLTPPRPS